MVQEKRVAVLTSGGDSQGMNAALRAIVRTCISREADVFAVYEGYSGLVCDTPENPMIKQVEWSFVAGILNLGGTIIGSARNQEFRTREGRLKAAYNLIRNRISYLVVIGGDGSLTGADLLRREWPSLLDELVEQGKCEQSIADKFRHLVVVGLVGSIDNDMCGTDYTIGCDTALHRIVESIDSILSTAVSHQRSFVVEVMGRNCGWLALVSGLITGADFVLFPEVPPIDGWEEHMVADVETGRVRGTRCSLVIIAEGAIDRNGNPIKAEYVKSVLEKRANHDTRITILGHVQRGGTPSAMDRIISTQMGVEAVEALFSLDPEKDEPVMIGMQGNRMVRVPLMKSVEMTRAVAKAIQEKNFARALELRGPYFNETYRVLSVLYSLRPQLLKEVTVPSLRVAIVHSGGPSPGMNPAVRAAVRLGIDKGFTMLGIQNGFQGLSTENGDIVDLNWMTVNGWAVKGGAELGTNRSVPNEKNIDAIVRNIEKHRIDVILMFGGFNGYEAALAFEYYKSKYPILQKVSILCVPGTIANNLPGTEQSIGADTSLNNIMHAIDKIKESAVSSRRVFVVEVMGADCGYLAVMTGIATGAERAYMNEFGLSLPNILDDLKMMSKRFQRGNRLGLIITSEKASPTYTTHVIASLLKEESGKWGGFEVRESILGHLQQGGRPSPFDRLNASLIMDHAINFIFDGLKKTRAGESSGSNGTQQGRPVIPSGVLGYIKGEVVFTPMSEIPHLLHHTLRRPKHQWWMELIPIAELIANEEQICYL